MPSPLLPQPDGFEGGIVVEKKLLANDSAGGERHDDGPVVVNRGSAAEPAADDAPSHEGAIVAEVHELSWRELEVAPLSGPALLEANALVPTAVHGVVAELYESRVGDQFDLRVITGDGRLEVAAVMRLESQPSRATECRSPQPGARRQAPDQSVDERENAGEAQAEALLKTAAGMGSHGQWLAQDLRVLLRHRLLLGFGSERKVGECTLSFRPEHEPGHLALPEVNERRSFRPHLPELQAACLAPPAGLDQREHRLLV